MIGMVPTPMMMVIFARVWPQKATMAITATMAGNARITNEPALKAMSKAPPLNPEMSPRVPPMSKPMPTAAKPTTSDTREPNTIRLSRSRPSSSVPRRWWMFGPMLMAL